MEVGLVSQFSGLTGGKTAQSVVSMNQESAKFENLVKEIKENNQKKSTVSSSQIIKEGRLNGDVTSDFSDCYKYSSDKASLAKGAAANQANPHVQTKKIDRTSKLYEKSMELESFFVKQMLSQMRKTINKSPLGGEGMAGQMYEDMLYDEYAVSMTKNAGFGLADQIYLSLRG